MKKYFLVGIIGLILLSSFIISSDLLYNKIHKQATIGEAISVLPPVKQDGNYIIPRVSGSIIGSSTVNIASKTATTTNLCFVGSGTCMTSPSSGVGTVTSVGLIASSSLRVYGSPITASGSFGLGVASGYEIPLTASTSNWQTAYSWGNPAGLYDPYGQATSTLSSHTTTYNHANYNTAYTWGNHATAGYESQAYASTSLASLTGNNTFTGLNILGNASTSQLSVSNNTYFPSGIWNSSGNVGIGTTSANNELTIYKDNTTGGALSLQNQSSLFRLITSSGINYFQSATTTTNGSAADFRLTDYGGSNAWLTVKANGYVGIASSSPFSPLSVVGNSSLVGNVGIGTLATTDLFTVKGGNQIMIHSGADSPILQFNSSGGYRMNMWQPSGNVSFKFKQLDGQGMEFTSSANASLLKIQDNGTISASSATILGNWDYTSAILKLPNSANLYTNTAGEIGIDTTGGQLRWNDGVATRTVQSIIYKSFRYATSTAWTATSTLCLDEVSQDETYVNVKCGMDTGTLFVQPTFGAYNLNSFTASTTRNLFSFSTNNSLVSSTTAEFCWNIGTPASSPTNITCTVGVRINPN